MVLLGDMPHITSGLINRILDGFDPAKERSICVAAADGRRGHPVLWSKAYFPEILALQGDVGAKSLMARHGDHILEIETQDGAVLTDIDTPEALAACAASG
jgi:molybdenum cofactor cytidylyltransferase